MMIDEKPIRPSYNTYFMDICKVVATRSTCIRHHVGAIITKNKRILSTGYNGAPAGLHHCIDIGCPRKDMPSGTMHELCRAVHAEQNAIIQAALHGISIEGATLYCTHQPCILCSKMIINSGIVEVVYEEEYNEKSGLKMLREAGIKILQYKKYEELDKIEMDIHEYKMNNMKSSCNLYKKSTLEIIEFSHNHNNQEGLYTHSHSFSINETNNHQYTDPILIDLDPSIPGPQDKHPNLFLQTVVNHHYVSQDLHHKNEYNKGMLDCQNVPIPAWKRIEIRKIKEV